MRRMGWGNPWQSLNELVAGIHMDIHGILMGFQWLIYG
jgi:hypothetical protein